MVLVVLLRAFDEFGVNIYFKIYLEAIKNLQVIMNDSRWIRSYINKKGLRAFSDPFSLLKSN